VTAIAAIENSSQGVPNMFNVQEVSLSDNRLTAIESIGGIAASYFGDRLQHQVPRDWPSAISRFLSLSNSPNARRSVSSRTTSPSRPFLRPTTQPKRRVTDDDTQSPTAA
jgi:hypothetical protein